MVDKNVYVERSPKTEERVSGVCVSTSISKTGRINDVGFGKLTYWEG